MTTPSTTHRWFHLTPDRLVLPLLAVEVLLWLSERFGWLGWHKGYAVLTSVAVVGGAMFAMLVWFVVALVFRRRFQFSIRSLLVLVVVVAVPCSWLAVQREQARRERNSAESIEETGAIVEWSDPSAPRWLRLLLGADFFGYVRCVDLRQHCWGTGLPLRSRIQIEQDHAKAAVAALKHLEGLSRLQNLDLSDVPVSDAGLKHIEGLCRLQELRLERTQVTNAGLETLEGLQQLQKLDLGGTAITGDGLRPLRVLHQLQELRLACSGVSDAGMMNLTGLSQLQDLDLENTRVTDAGLEHLEGLNQLKNINLRSTKVTDAGLKRLKALSQLQDLGLDRTEVIAVVLSLTMWLHEWGIATSLLSLGIVFVGVGIWSKRKSYIIGGWVLIGGLVVSAPWLLIGISWVGQNTISVTVRVQDHSGTPIPNATVRLTDKIGSSTASTDSSGLAHVVGNFQTRGTDTLLSKTATVELFREQLSVRAIGFKSFNRELDEMGCWDLSVPTPEVHIQLERDEQVPMKK